jgi:Fe-S-cluster containining protein
VRDGWIPITDLYTIRKGELVHDPISDRLRVTGAEFLKVREREDSGECLYYDPQARACRIYSHRPSQCKALTCWDPTEFMEVYRRPKASRQDLVEGETRRALITKHEERCSYRVLAAWVGRIETMGEPAVREILDILRFDGHFRTFVSENLPMDPKEMDFLFGRPLVDTIRMFQLRVIREPDGSFLLTVSTGPQT